MFSLTLMLALLLQLQILVISMPISLTDLFGWDSPNFVYMNESEVPPEIVDWGYGKLEEAEDQDVLRTRTNWMAPYVCTTRYEYNISHQFAIEDPPALIAGAVCNATYSGCNIGDTLGYAVTVTTTLGFHLDFASILGLGIQGDVSLSTTNSEAVTISESCPPGFTCGVQAVAHKLNVTGWEMTTHGEHSQGCEQRTTWQPYEVHFPLLLNNSQPNAQAWVEYSICLQNNSVNEYKRPVSIPLCPPFPNNEPGRDYAKTPS